MPRSGIRPSGNWYPGDKDGKGGIYEFRDQARAIAAATDRRFPRRRSKPARRSPGSIRPGSCADSQRRALLDCVQRPSADRQRHEDDPSRRGTRSSGIVSEGQRRRRVAKHVSRPGAARTARPRTHATSRSAIWLLTTGDGRAAARYQALHRKRSEFDGVQFEHAGDDLSKISEDQLFHCPQRGIPTEAAIALIVNGFVKEALQELPDEFAVEAQKLISISLEGSVG